MLRRWATILLVISTAARAEGAAPEKLPLDVPLVQAPESFLLGYRFPTWDQAFHIAHDELLLTHWGLHELTRGWNPWLGIPVELVSTAVLDFIELPYLGGTGWAHEEAHREVMAASGVPSINGLNDYLNPFVRPSVYAVHGMTDEQLAQMKERHNADFTHLQEAGLETQAAILTALDRDTFFYDRPAYQNILYQLYARLQIAGYYQVCTQVTEELVQEVGVPAEILERDFTGPDCTGWAYDMTHPAEPYSARGPDPSGIGIRRYRVTSDLGPDGYFAIIRQRNLVLLSLVDPQVFGFGSFEATSPFDGQPFRWNAGLSSQVTPFGSAVDLNLFFKQRGLKAHGILRAYRNQSLTLPGLELNVVRVSAALGGIAFQWSATAGLWLQPANGEFFDTSLSVGGRLGGAVHVPVTSFLDAYLRADLKTSGWVPLTTSLGPAASASLGATVKL